MHALKKKKKRIRPEMFARTLERVELLALFCWQKRISLKLLLVITTALWRRICLNWKHNKEQEGKRRGETDA